MGRACSIEGEKCLQILVANPEWKKSLGGPKHGRENNISPWHTSS
jgi:hypothetical protein